MPVDPTTRRFVSASQAALLEAQAELDAAEQAHASLESRLSAAIKADPNTALAIIDEFTTANSRISAARAAVEAAMTDEDRRQRADALKQLRSRTKASKAHLVNFSKSARYMSQAVNDLRLAHRDCLSALDGARATLPSDTPWPPMSGFWEADLAAAAAADARVALGLDSGDAGRLAVLVEKISVFLAEAIADIELQLPDADLQSQPEAEEAA